MHYKRLSCTRLDGCPIVKGVCVACLIVRISGDYSLKMIPIKTLVVPEVLEVHVIPSDEVRIVPELPTVINSSFPWMTLLKFSVVPEELFSQFLPLSVDLIMVPLSPTDTKVLFPKVTPQRSFNIPEELISQLIPLSVDLIMIPLSPTDTKVLSP